MKLFYWLGVKLYSVAVHLAAIWNPKAKKWVSGRKETWAILEKFRKGPQVERSEGIKVHNPNENQDPHLASSRKANGSKMYWFHCASLGEFEQGRPLIEALKQKEDCRIALSFFSPSGYEMRKNYELADVVFYLPADSGKNANRVYDLLKPTGVFFIKYEFWANYIFEAKKRAIPIYSVSAVFRKDQVFFKWYGRFMRSVLKSFSKIFVQNEASAKLLETIGVESIIAGDTRYDRVMKNAEKAQRFPLIDSFTKAHKIFVCGSLWPDDMRIISDGLKNLDDTWKIILTTHEIDGNHLHEAEQFFAGEKVIRYSKLTPENADAKILLIDNVGMLMHVYGYGNLAYVGGAFKTGLHNILEPASFGLPVIFGPNHEKFPEASLFREHGIGFSVSSKPGFETVLAELQRTELSTRVLTFMNSSRGATARILNELS